MKKWMFPKIVVPQNGWFTIENPIKMDDLGVPLFLETPKWIIFHCLPLTIATGVAAPGQVVRRGFQELARLATAMAIRHRNAPVAPTKPIFETGNEGKIIEGGTCSIFSVFFFLVFGGSEEK